MFLFQKILFKTNNIFFKGYEYQDNQLTGMFWLLYKSDTLTAVCRFFEEVDSGNKAKTHKHMQTEGCVSSKQYATLKIITMLKRIGWIYKWSLKYAQIEENKKSSSYFWAYTCKCMYIWKLTFLAPSWPSWPLFIRRQDLHSWKGKCVLG